MRILEDYRDGRPVVLMLCLACSEVADEPTLSARVGLWPDRLRVAAAWLMVLGLIGAAATIAT